MKRLPTEIAVQNRTLKQKRRQGLVVLYELFGPRGRLHGYEVIVIKVRPPEVAFGYSLPEREVYPGNEDWGMYGWTFTLRDLAGAERKFNSLVSKWGGNVPGHENKADLAGFGDQP